MQAPPGEAIRPTSDRVREAVFNILASRWPVAGATVADLFAGTGALGIEALSRGARRVTFVDHDRQAVAAVRANLAATGLAGEEAVVVRADVMGWAATAEPVDVAFADPPYAFDRWSDLQGCLRARLLVAESDRPVEPAAGWRVLSDRRYGGTVVTLLTSPEPSPS